MHIRYSYLLCVISVYYMGMNVKESFYLLLCSKAFKTRYRPSLDMSYTPINTWGLTKFYINIVYLLHIVYIYSGETEDISSEGRWRRCTYDWTHCWHGCTCYSTRSLDCYICICISKKVSFI